MTAWERALYGNLKTLRMLIAQQQKAPAYTVFSDASLIDMLRKHPTSLDGFLDVSGVGAAKQKEYGNVFLSVLRDGREPNDAFEMYLDEKREEEK